MKHFTTWMNEHLLSCFWKKYLGIECPGCGMQRSFVALLNGDFRNSLQLYPALIPMLVMFSALALHLIFNFKNGARFLKINFFITALLIISSYLYKIL
jgi:hypothetical protein